jgi:hypothetical protein
MQHNVADIQRGGGIIQPMQAEMSQPGTGIMGALNTPETKRPADF